MTQLKCIALAWHCFQMPLGQLQSTTRARARLKPEQADACDSATRIAHPGELRKALGTGSSGQILGTAWCPPSHLQSWWELSTLAQAETLGEGEKIRAPPPTTSSFPKQARTQRDASTQQQCWRTNPSSSSPVSAAAEVEGEAAVGTTKLGHVPVSPLHTGRCCIAAGWVHAGEIPQPHAHPLPPIYFIFSTTSWQRDLHVCFSCCKGPAVHIPAPSRHAANPYLPATASLFGFSSEWDSAEVFDKAAKRFAR